MPCTQAVDYVCRESQLSDMPGYEILLVGKEGLVAGLQGERVGTFPPELSVRSQRCEQQQVGFCADGTVGRGPRLVLSGGRRLYQVPGSGSGGQRDLGGGAGHSPLPEGLACLQAAPVHGPTFLCLPSRSSQRSRECPARAHPPCAAWHRLPLPASRAHDLSRGEADHIAACLRAQHTV